MKCTIQQLRRLIREEIQSKSQSQNLITRPAAHGGTVLKDGHATVVVDETDSHIFVIDPSGNSIEIPFWENVAARVGIDYSAELSAKKKVASEIVSQYGLDTVTDKGGRTMSAEEWINKSK